MKKIYNFFIILIASLFSFTVQAEYKLNTDYRPINSPYIPDYSQEKVSLQIAKIILVLLRLSGGVAVFFLVFGGFLYVTAMGKQENMDKAKRTITWAILGLLAIILSYAIVQNLLKIIFNVPIDTSAGM